MNETARILCAISTLRPVYPLEADTALKRLRITHVLEALESTELVLLTREHGEIIAAILTPLGAERAREAMEGGTA